MSEHQDQPSTVDFTFDPSSPSKEPAQFVSLLENALRREFPQAVEIVDIVHAPGEPVVTVRHLEKLDEQMAKEVTHKARGVFREFMTSPWY